MAPTFMGANVGGVGAWAGTGVGAAQAVYPCCLSALRAAALSLVGLAWCALSTSHPAFTAASAGNAGVYALSEKTYSSMEL